MHWTEIARRNHHAAQQALVDTVNTQAISVPIGDTDAGAPGYLDFGHFYSCIPDPQYPWDPDVLRAIRVLCPDAMPIVIRSVWRWSNYHERGKIDAPMVLVRHGIARAVEDSMWPLHTFHCEMPADPIAGLLIPGRTLDQCRPNYIEVVWHDRLNKEHGPDLPGAYIPFDWELYASCHDSYETNLQELRYSRREVEDGEVIARNVASRSIEAARDAETRHDESRRSEAAYIRADRDRFYSVEPSDVEWKEAFLGGPKQPSPPVSIAVPAAPEYPADPTPL